jgi:hypothetical protein
MSRGFGLPQAVGSVYAQRRLLDDAIAGSSACGVGSLDVEVWLLREGPYGVLAQKTARYTSVGCDWRRRCRYLSPPWPNTASKAYARAILGATAVMEPTTRRLPCQDGCHRCCGCTSALGHDARAGWTHQGAGAAKLDGGGGRAGRRLSRISS